MSHPFLALVWASGEEERPYEYIVFDRYVDRLLQEEGEAANDIATSLGGVISEYGADLPSKLTSESGSQFLVISLDASKIRGAEEVLYADDLKDVVEDAQAHVAAQPTGPVPEFESRANRVARGYLVPATRIPASVTQFVKEYGIKDNDNMKIDAERSLRETMADGFPRLPSVERAALFERLFADLPRTFAEQAAALQDIVEGFRQELAARLTPELNVYLKGLSPNDSEAKKELAGNVMELLTSLGLAIRCPKTGAASTLNVWTDAKHPLGRFTIQPKGEKKPSVMRAILHDLLPLELMGDRPRREALKEWRASHVVEGQG